MSRYNANYPHSNNPKSSGAFDGGLKIDRHDDHASQSGSEDGNYAHFAGDPLKMEDLEDDSNTALTSQTLNADGTPKRPMNAFMIFARRRRPQVSAENQAMRTGEISKILSKEWVSMPPSEKQFYLEQAKQLKENFNTRYPDYVYRRRPNNSRKRRRSDAARPGDQTAFDQGDLDASGSVDLEASPTDGDDSHLDIDSPYSRSSYVSTSSIDNPKYNSLTRPVSSVTSEPIYRPGGDYTASERMGPLGPATSPRLSIGHSGMGYPAFNQSSSHNQTAPSLYSTQAIPSPQGWQSRVDRPNSSWLGGSHDRISGSLSSPKQSHFTSSNSWSSSSENASGPPSASPGSANFFPTLNTPFYPGQPHGAPFQSNASTSSSQQSLTHQNAGSYDGPLGPLQTGSMAREYPRSSYEPSLSPLSSYSSSSSRDPLSSYSSRSLPPVQTGSGYPPPPSSGHGPSSYWARD